MSHCRAPDNEEEEGWCGEDGGFWEMWVLQDFGDYGDFRKCHENMEIHGLRSAIVGLLG